MITLVIQDAPPPLIPPVSITPYLSCSGVINCTNAEIRTLARTITTSEIDDIERTRTLYTWVRDSIAHSVDAGHKDLMWNATDVLNARHGLCFGKSHLFVALCRALGIPAGLCYQRVRSENGAGCFMALLQFISNLWINGSD